MSAQPFSLPPSTPRVCRQLAALLLLTALQAPVAWAHDSWFTVTGGGSAASPRLLVGTGNRYPVMEVGPAPESVLEPRCTDGRGVRPLRPGNVDTISLTLTLRSAGDAPVLACWLELAQAEVAIDPERVQVYLDEIRTSAANRDNWAALRARGVGWQESYRKYARIELPAAADAGAAELAAARRPVGLALELVVLGDQPLRRGEEAAFQVLRDGQPLAGLSIELINERSPLGLWRTTDAQGVIRQAMPLAGRWLLRATDLRIAAASPEQWESRFVTLAVGVR